VSRGVTRRELLVGRLRRALLGPQPGQPPEHRVHGVSREVMLYAADRPSSNPGSNHAGAAAPDPEEAPPPWLMNDPSRS